MLPACWGAILILTFHVLCEVILRKSWLYDCMAVLLLIHVLLLTCAAHVKVLALRSLKLCFVFFLTSILAVRSLQMVFIVLNAEFSISPCVSRLYDPNGRSTANWEFIPSTLASGLFIHSFIYLYPMWQI